MKLLYSIGAVALIYANIASANEETIKDLDTLASETLSLPELISYIEDIVFQLIDTNEELRQFAYDELKESLKIIYTIDCLHLAEASTILQVLDECYAMIGDAIEKDPDNNHILEQSLSLFNSGRNYDHDTLIVQPIEDWRNTTNSNILEYNIEASNADLVYIQDNAAWNIQEGALMTAVCAPSRVPYRIHPIQDSSPKILIIKSGNRGSDDSLEYKLEVGRQWKFGGKDHGKSSSYFEGEIKDRNGNYAKGKVSKEEDDDGYDCNIKAGREKRNR